MRSQRVGNGHRLTGIFSLSLCLALLGIIILGVTERTDAASVTGSLPEIKVFSAAPLTLPDGSSSLYTFVVSGATNMRVVEAGEIIKEINSPPDTTLNGTVKGRTTYEIRVDSINTFDTVLIAKNGSGEQKKTLTLSFATVLPQQSTSLAPGSDNQTKARTPKWGPQSSTSPTIAASTLSITTRDAPQFAKCPTNCNNCLRPDEAAARGFTQRCSEQPCYYSPDNQQKWYCYSEPKGWCCKEGQAGQAGQVVEATKSECAQAGGGYWSTDKNEAIQACQPLGWCCRNGQIAQTTRAECSQVGGQYWSTDKNETIQACQPVGWFCSGGSLYQGTQAQAAQAGANWYATQAQAAQACQPPCWCCSGGKVYQTTQAACTRAGGACYSTESQATAACRGAGTLTPKLVR
ncbi:MAG: hypothetical protein ACYDHZ_08885 [Dehalococcoidia bacterium]